MMGDEAVIASIALPFVEKPVRDVILEHLRGRATVEKETADARRVKLTGPEAKSDRVLEILQAMTKS
jgi:hypothetical protein